MKVMVVVLLREVAGSAELLPLTRFPQGENSSLRVGLPEPRRRKEAAPESALPFWTWFTENPGRVAIPRAARRH
jgi:hypothetical protein